MSCCGKHLDRAGRPMPPHDGHAILPSEPCIFCAEKHLDYAFHLSSREVGYSAVNRADAIGSMVAAQWHLHPFDFELAKSLRDIRHRIQMRQEAAIDWKPALSAMDALASAEAAKLKENGHVPH